MTMEIDKRKKSPIHKALDKLIEANGGSVTKKDIVAEALKPGTAFNKEAEKSGLLDLKKAQLFALTTWAGGILQSYRVYVTIAENRDPVRVRGIVSLLSDRGKSGYRSLVTVMSDDGKRAELLETAKRELAAFRKKYAILEELAPVFQAADSL